MTTPKIIGAGLEDVGVPGRNFLRNALTSCTDPLKAIEEFQLENGILLPSLRPMLPLLDLHGVRRLDFHTSVLEELRDRLVQHINEIGQKEGKERDRKLKELLAKSFPVVRVKALRPVVMCILRNTPHIDDKYLKVLVRDRELYNDTDTEVKRQIWKDNQSLFGDEVSPLLSQYIKEKETVLFDHLNLTNLFFTPSPKVRRQGEVVQKLAHMIGNSVKLYDMVLQFLRTLFLRTRNIHYCTLRAELLMALHDLEVQDIISVDPCHKFTWCLDACIREKNVDIKRSRELQLANALVLSPTAEDGEIEVRISEFKEPKLDSQILTKFLPALMSLMVDDQVRALNSKLPPDERESAITIIEHSGETCLGISESSVTSILAMYYTLHSARSKDRVGLMRILGTLANCHNDRAFEDPFLHSLHNETVRRLYESLLERIGNQQEPAVVPTNMDHLDSPLLSVPTPAPL
uniref:Negative elongation factor B n=1 Tax=Timema cristinae TaxID=61476 RepID=A0A7R9CXB4_TIMCR|nr:unnamed protein product [Timema cristinae]